MLRSNSTASASGLVHVPSISCVIIIDYIKGLVSVQYVRQCHETSVFYAVALKLLQRSTSRTVVGKYHLFHIRFCHEASIKGHPVWEMQKSHVSHVLSDLMAKAYCPCGVCAFCVVFRNSLVIKIQKYYRHITMFTVP